MSQLVLSIFPGIDILGKAFEEEGYCVVRGPDILWGGDIRNFYPPANVFAGVIGGPPCQVFSRMRFINPRCGKSTGNLIPEFERVITEAQPTWFVMENIQEAPIPQVPGYIVDPTILNAHWLGDRQNRVHRFSFGTRDGRKLIHETVLLESPIREPRLVASHYTQPQIKLNAGHVPKKLRFGLPITRFIPDACQLQGLPVDFFEFSPFTKEAQMKMLANAVPLIMGRALARAIKKATE